MAETATVSVALNVADAPQIESITVTAARLREAQIALSPKVGTTVYTVDQALIDEYGKGANTPMNEVLMQLPGVAHDSKASGYIHVRDDHANVQFRINGVTLPEGISGFRQSIDSRFVDHIDFVTGAVPAQFGQRTAGIVEIQTKDGIDTAPGGSVGLLAGGHSLWQPSVEFLGSSGTLNYYVTGKYLSSDQGIENPTSSRNAIHDHTEQVRSFGYVSKVVDDDTRIAMMASTYQGKFQIPNNPDQAASFHSPGVSNIDTGFNAIPSANLEGYVITGRTRFRIDCHEWEPVLWIKSMRPANKGALQTFDGNHSPFHKSTFPSAAAATRFALSYGERVAIGLVGGLHV